MNIQAALVRAILEKWSAYEWTVQGFGFVRTKIANVGRIHVWDSSLRTPNVSDLHTHPWPLHSTIISGELLNVRYSVLGDGDTDGRLPTIPHVHSRLKTGEGGGLVGDQYDVELMVKIPEHYLPGDTYEQAPDEVHRTIAQDGTVTLLTRPQGPPLEEASVFWRRGSHWVSAEPCSIIGRPLQSVIDRALAAWHPRE